MAGRMAKWTTSLLRTARMAYIAAATACVGVAAVGFAIALYFQFVIVKGPNQIAVPPIPAIAMPAIPDNAVDDRLKPPSRIRIVLTRPVIDRPLSNMDVLGYFQAKTANGLANYPDNIDIIGGRDAALFDRGNGTAQPTGNGATLSPTVKFVGQVNQALQSNQEQKRYDFALIVVARDVYGLRSDVSDVAFSLTYGMSPAPAPAPPPAAAPEMSELQRLARDIALIAGQDGSPGYRDMFKRAMSEPDSCRANAGNADFVSAYRRLFDHAKPNLTPVNLDAFLGGVCDSWYSAITAQQRALAEARRAQDSAVSANRSAEFEYRIEAAAADGARNLTLIVVGSAFGAFLMICLVLAFLAMENHSNAMRDALATFLELERQKPR